MRPADGSTWHSAKMTPVVPIKFEHVKDMRFCAEVCNQQYEFERDVQI